MSCFSSSLLHPSSYSKTTMLPLIKTRRLGYSSSSSGSSFSSSSGSSIPSPSKSSSSSHSSSTSSSSNSNNSNSMTNGSDKNLSTPSWDYFGSSPSPALDNFGSESTSEHTNIFATNSESSNNDEAISNTSNNAFTDYSLDPNLVHPSMTEDRHDNEAPKHSNIFTCGYQGDPRVRSMAVDVEYRYEIIIPRHVSNNEALLRVESSIMQDLSNVLGCHQMTRNLRLTLESTNVIGFQWFEGNHLNGKLL